MWTLSLFHFMSFSFRLLMYKIFIYIWKLHIYKLKVTVLLGFHTTPQLDIFSFTCTPHSPSFLFVCFLVFLFVCFFETRFLNIALDVLILRNPPASASQVLGLKPCTTTASSFPPLWPLYSPFLFKKINFWRSCKWIHTHMYTLPLTAQLNKEMIWYWIKNCTW